MEGMRKAGPLATAPGRARPHRGLFARRHREPKGAFVMGLGRKQVQPSSAKPFPKQFHNCRVQAPVLCMRTPSREGVHCIVVLSRNVKCSVGVSDLGYPQSDMPRPLVATSRNQSALAVDVGLDILSVMINMCQPSRK